MAWWKDNKHLKNNQLWSWKETDKQENMQTGVEKNRKNMKSWALSRVQFATSLWKKTQIKRMKKLKHVNKDSKY